jgi:hypothetical protein
MQQMNSDMINRIQVTIGVAILMAGVAVYLCDRPSGQIYFLKKVGISDNWFDSPFARFKTIGNSLPCFAHTLAMILITAGLIARQEKGYGVVSLFWLAVDWTLELGQRFDALASALTPDWFEAIPFFENAENYFRKGTFDWYDMAFILAGAVTAYPVLVLTRDKRGYQRAPAC